MLSVNSLSVFLLKSKAGKNKKCQGVYKFLWVGLNFGDRLKFA